MTPSDPAAAPPKDNLAGQLRSLTGIFWISGWMELIERFSYYGVRVVLPVFMVAALGKGGPELTQIQKGEIFAVWAVVQSFVPILSGGFADRYGYKVNIAIATALKIVGYMIMGYCIPLSEMLAGMPLAEARAKGIDHVYGIFFGGAMLLAFGTAIFKPGIGGLIASQLDKRNSSLGWSIFYQLVNVGAFFGPLIAGYLRVIEWHWVFILCSVAVALNFIPLFFFPEPPREEVEGAKKPGPLRMLYESMQGLLEPRLFFFTIGFAGFWLMSTQLFDILPNFIDDWIDSRHLAGWLQSIVGEGRVPLVNGGNLTQEWMLNFNALLISLATFLMGYMTRKVPSLVTIIAGVVMAIVATTCLGASISGWWMLACIGLFSLGEMMSGPTTSRYVVEIAPKGREALYIGFGNFTFGIGWSLGSLVAGHLYQKGGDKVVLARRYLSEKFGMAADQVDALPKDDVMPRLAELTGTDSFGATRLLWDAYNPHSMWIVFAVIGIASMFLLVVYNQIIKAANRDAGHAFNRHGDLWVRIFLVPITLAFIATSIHLRTSVGLWLNAGFFTAMLIISFLPHPKPTPPAADAG